MWLLEAAIKKGWRGEGGGGKKKEEKVCQCKQEQFVQQRTFRSSGRAPAVPSGLCAERGLCAPCPPRGPAAAGHKPIAAAWPPPRRQHEVFSKLRVFSEPVPLRLGRGAPTLGAVAGLCVAWARWHAAGSVEVPPPSARSYF